MDIAEALAGRINLIQINQIVAWAVDNPANKKRLWESALADDNRVSANALWVMTHLPLSEMPWLQSLQNELTDILMPENSATKKRLLLQLLREQQFHTETFRTDLLDYCFSKINSECEPYAVRCFSIYIAFKICSPHPELITELNNHLELLTYQQLSPGLKSALKQTQLRISRLEFKAPNYTKP